MNKHTENSPFFFFILSVFFVFMLCVVPRAQASALSVLQLNSYHLNFPTAPQVKAGAESILGPAGIEMDVEFLDSKRYPDEENYKRVASLLEFKLTNRRPYSAVLTSDDNALRFALLYKDRLFKNIPIVFCGVNDVNLALSLNSNPQVTGVVEAVSMRETIDLALRLDPRVKRVVAVTDSTTSGQGDLQTFLGLRDSYPQVPLDVLDLGKLSWRELGHHLQLLPEDTVVLLLSAYADAKNVRFDFEEGLSRLVADCPVPIYHLWRHGIGKGILGGVVISHYHQARAAAVRVVDIIVNGEFPSAMPVSTVSPNVPVFDDVLIHRWGFDSSLLPDNTELINSLPTFWERVIKTSRVVLVTFGLLMILVSCLVVYIISRRRRYYGRVELMRKLETAHRELQDTQDYLKSILDVLPAGLILLDCDGRIVNFNSNAQKWAANPGDIVRGSMFFSVFSALPLTPAQLDITMARMDALHITNCQIELQDVTVDADITVYPIHSLEGDRAVVRCEDVSGQVRIRKYMVGSELYFTMCRVTSSVVNAVNNPLSAVIQDIQNLQRRLGDSLEDNAEAARLSGCSMGSIQEYCERRGITSILHNMRKSSAEMGSVISELGVFANDDAMHSHVDLRELVNTAIQHAVREHELSVSGRMVRAQFVVTVVDATASEVECDAHELEQILLNLFKWQIALCIDSETGAEHVIKVSVQAEHGVILLSVHNKAMIMDIETQLLFSAFAERRVRNIPLLGTEATLVYFMLIMRNKGSLEVKPHEEGGGVFSVRISLS